MYSMKWITPIWRDPEGWAVSVAKSKLRVIILSTIHLFSVFGFLYLFALVIKTLGDIPNLGWIFIIISATPIVTVGVIWPVMYLYSIHKILNRN